ncbi:MAG: guanylate kinase [Anaerolineae bacterium]|jgi:guanylate kinase|nr:guanylate kinase [Anaerolineae bacterium]
MRDATVVDPYHPQITPLLVVISGPSGVGKDSLVEAMKEHGAQFHFVITATSRPPRPGEIHGVDYFFVSPAAFEAMVEQDELLEYAIVYEQYKGIPKQQVREALASGQDVVMRLDVQGAATIKRLLPEAILIFLTASSEAELVERLQKRQTESEAQLQRRIETARQEMERIVEFDYVVINRECELDDAVAKVLQIIQAEHLRVHPREVSLA